MPNQRILQIGGLNTYVNPLNNSDGELLFSLNVESYPYGAKKRRSGYTTFLGTADGSKVNSLFSWTENNNTLHLYRASGSALYHSTDGTGPWTTVSNGTINNDAHVGHAILNNAMIIGDGVGSTRHTSNGTSFTDTTLAPVSAFFEQYQNRIYTSGTASDLFYSTANDVSNWNTSGTSDSSSISIPGAGKNGKLFKVADRLIATKTSGLMYKWDGYSLVDSSSKMGPSSPYSYDNVEGYGLWLNRLGIVGYGGGRPEILSNAIQSQIYNSAGNGITGANFATASGIVHKYDYYVSVGTVTDDINGETINDAIIKYDFQKNEFLNYKFENFPTSWLSYTDSNGLDQLIFGDATGQCYKLSGTANTDNGTPIESRMRFVIHLGTPEYEKKWNKIIAFFNPGCEARVQVAMENTFTKQVFKWVSLGDVSDGRKELDFPVGSRSSLLFVDIVDNSRNADFRFYGFSVDADVIQK